MCMQTRVPLMPSLCSIFPSAFSTLGLRNSGSLRVWHRIDGSLIQLNGGVRHSLALFYAPACSVQGALRSFLVTIVDVNSDKHRANGSVGYFRDPGQFRLSLRVLPLFRTLVQIGSGRA